MTNHSFPVILVFAALVCVSMIACAQIVPFESSNLPVITIMTDGTVIPDEPKSTAWMCVYENRAGRTGIDCCPVYQGSIGIELRGNGSRIHPKQQFGIETRDAKGGDTDVPLLGMPSESDWVLSAAASDKSLIRDALGFSIAASMGRYASRTRFCELLINGLYQGVYILEEKIKRGAHRVNIAKLTPADSQGVALTGGYIFKMDPGKGLPFEGWSASFDATGYFAYLYHYPLRENITPAQRYYITEWFAAFEDAMRAGDYTDSLRGYRGIMDAGSFVDHLIMQELSYNGDGYTYSTYFQKDRDDRGGKLAMGPVWDFYAAFGNCFYGNGGLAEGWRIHSERRPFWWYRLLRDDGFLADLRNRWTELRRTVLSGDVLIGRIDSLASLLEEAQQRNFLRWNIMGRWLIPNSYVGTTYADEIRFLKRWLTERLLWIDGNIGALSDSVVTMVPPRHFEITGVHPNPASQTVYVSYVTKEFADVTVDIVDVLGTTVRRFSERALPAGRHRQPFDMTGVPSGVYVVRMFAADGPRDSRLLPVLN